MVRSGGGEDGVRSGTLWQRLLGLEWTVVEDVEFDADAEAVVSVRPRKRARQRCGRCRRRAPWYDRGHGRRRWRSLDVGTIVTFGAWHSWTFDDQVVWLAVHSTEPGAVHPRRGGYCDPCPRRAA